MSANARQVSIRVSPELMRSVLQLPEGTAIIGACWDFDFQCVRLYLQSGDFSELAPGQMIPVVEALVSTISGEMIQKVTVTFNLPKREGKT